jgi:hypothetical protein
MSLALLVAMLAGALSLGMLSAVLPLGRRREDVELAPLFEVEFFDVGGPVIDLEPTH